jgi:hypothetical protein
MKVVNVWHYGGRAEAEAQGVVYVGRPHPLGNRWSHKPWVNAILVDSVETAVANYRRWLFERLRANDPEVVAALEALNEDDTIGCWCVPNHACHAEVVAAAWDWWHNRGGREACIS